MSFRTRFAPSPTGLLHLGHAYSAMLAHDMSRAAGGALILRIEDTDTGRCRPEFETAIFDDLAWLGLNWATPVMRQSQRRQCYMRALNVLVQAGFCYPCNCSRRDIRQAISAPQDTGTPHSDRPYPGTCRHRTMQDRSENDAIRLNVAQILRQRPDIIGLSFNETGEKHAGHHELTRDRLLGQIGDIVLARRDIDTASYHLAVVVDDAAQGVSDIIRGDDLFEATFTHRLLQAVLGLATPSYHHHRLIRDSTGKRLAKRDGARAIRTLRDDGLDPDQIRSLVGL